MLFNSLSFSLFFIVVFFLYLVLKCKWQNRVLLLASCIFYAAWDWKFLSLIFISISTDYFCSIAIRGSDNEKIKKLLLILSIAVNLSILGLFKYFNFFSANLTQLINLFGFSVQPYTINIILPIGISFYTFKTMSYTIDVYTGKIEPARNYLDYALFVIFFPLLLAGPIMRAGDLLPQIASPRKLSLNKFYEGSYLIFWGLFQKIVVADNLADIANSVFNGGPPYNGLKVLIALYAFAFQIYCDFSGYSNIARGLGSYMGFNIMVNFNLPYFATNPQDFWQRWHISLSNWFRDYLYYPIALRMRKWGVWSSVFALMVTFILCGLWHGASWKFIIWGAYQGMLLIAYKFLEPFLKNIPSPKHSFVEKIWFSIRVIFFFHLTCLGWLIFRGQSLSQIFSMLYSLIFEFNSTRIIFPEYFFLKTVFFSWLLIVVQLYQYRRKDVMVVFRSNFWIRTIFYFTLFLLIILFGDYSEKEFIYFQF